jgi:purine-binding chemotaxis protein CheW
MTTETTSELTPPELAVAELAVSDLDAIEGADVSNQFVTFVVADDHFAVPMAPVQEIIRVPTVARLPLAPASLLGLANLRGKVLPIVSLRHVFGMAEIDATDATRALVIDLGTPIGFVVDRVASVMAVEPGQIESAQSIQSSVSTDLLTGVLKLGDNDLTMVLDFASLIASQFSSLNKSFDALQHVGGAEREVKADDEEGATDELQLVSFKVENQEYAADINSVQEIVQPPENAVQVPNAAPHVLGLMTLRERLLPLVSLRILLGLPSRPMDDTQRVLVLGLGAGQAVGVVADSVDEVLRVPSKQVEPLPTMLSKTGGIDEVSSICRMDGGERLVSVLDTARMFNHPAIKSALSAASEKENLMENQDAAQSGEEEISEDDDQVVVFRLGAEEFGVPISSVQEIVRVPESLTHVPQAPEFVEGVINLRGAVLPVIDQRRRLGLPQAQRSDGQRIMVYALKGGRTGFIVDSVTEVLRIGKGHISPTPQLIGQHTDIMAQVANLEADKRMILLVNPQALLSEEEASDLAQVG